MSYIIISNIIYNLLHILYSYLLENILFYGMLPSFVCTLFIRILASNDSIGLLLWLIDSSCFISCFVWFDDVLDTEFGEGFDVGIDNRFDTMIDLFGWWNDHADGIWVGVGVGLIVRELIDHHHHLLLRLMIEILLLFLPLDHPSFPPPSFWCISLFTFISVQFYLFFFYTSPT